MFNSIKAFFISTCRKIKDFFKHPPKIKFFAIVGASCLFLYQVGLRRFFSHFKNLLFTQSKLLGGSLLVAGIVANTGLDNKLRQWWHHLVNRNALITTGLRHAKKLGEFGLPIVGVLLSILTIKNKIDSEEKDALHEFALQASLNLAVGYILQALSSLVLGGGRPIHQNGGSYWRGFLPTEEVDEVGIQVVEARHRESRRYAASGHAFNAAFPCLALAQQLDNPPAKYLLYGFSTMGALSRVDSDAHYPSQAFLGWAFAYATATASVEPSILDNSSALRNRLLSQ